MMKWFRLQCGQLNAPKATHLRGDARRGDATHLGCVHEDAICVIAIILCFISNEH